MFDSHCHLQFNAYNSDREEVIKRCQEKNVWCNVIGTQKDTSLSAVALAEKYDNFYATIGLHPIHITSTEVDEEEISFTSREEIFDDALYSEMAKSKKVVAIGECGLDLFHIPKNVDKKSARGGLNKIITDQSAQFICHLEFAKKHDLALVIHIRDAHDEMIDLLKSIHFNWRGVIHCYTGNWQQAQEYLNLGLHLGFTGVITFPPKKTDPKPQIDLIEVAKKSPLNRILVETDAPYLAPQAYRGKRCEPWMVIEVAKQLAVFRNKELAEIDEITTANTKKLFKIKNPLNIIQTGM